MAGSQEGYRSGNTADDEFLAELEEGIGCTCHIITPEQRARNLERARELMVYFDQVNQKGESDPPIVLDLL
jgi:hypothetical protein